jgi:uncharacterized OB-fold protein
VTEPAISQRVFFEKAGAGELTAIRCQRCHALSIPPREFCPSCGERAWQPVPLSGEGTIASYTVIRVAPRGHANDAPYAIAAVQLKEGVSLLGRLMDIPLDRLAIGLPVRFRPFTRGGQMAVGFGPA